MKLCKDCKQCKNISIFIGLIPGLMVCYPFPPIKFPHCMRNVSYTTNPVSGHVSHSSAPMCYSERIAMTECGPEAKYFEPRPTLWAKIKNWLRRAK